MASVTHSAIATEKTPVQKVDRRPSVHQESPKPSDPRGSLGVSIARYHADLSKVVGPEPTHSLLLSSLDTSRNPFFHEACVYLPDHEELYVTSNILQSGSSSQLPVILISKIKLRRDEAGAVEAVEWAKLRPPPSMPMPAGGARFAKGILFCSQGNLTPATGGLYYMPRGSPPQPMVASYHGRDFNSVHDVAVAADGSFWFTDPSHGFEQDFRKKPQLPCHVYRFDPETGDLRAVADSLGRPTGICFSPDSRTVYITDSDAVHGDGNQDPTRPASIYAFDLVQRSGSDFLTNKRLFAYALRGIPMGVKCDSSGNVYAGCADGVEVWNPGGTLLGVIEVQGGVTNFCFAREGEMFLCGEQRLWRLQLNPKKGDVDWNMTSSLDVNPDDNFI